MIYFYIGAVQICSFVIQVKHAIPVQLPVCLPSLQYTLHTPGGLSINKNTCSFQCFVSVKLVPVIWLPVCVCLPGADRQARHFLSDTPALFLTPEYSFIFVPQLSGWTLQSATSGLLGGTYEQYLDQKGQNNIHFYFIRFNSSSSRFLSFFCWD